MRRKGCFQPCGGDVMQGEVVQGIMIPFLGTVLGAACVLFMKNTLSLIAKNCLKSIHSSEPTLNDIFLDITGRTLL